MHDHATNLDPSDSILLRMAREALASQGSLGAADWPQLDLDDPDQRVFGDYELLEELGRGGMGVVFRARQRSLAREVAIKFIAAGTHDGVDVARFLDEARAAARLVHPNIVAVHEVGSVGPIHYFSMPLVQGSTLAQRLARGPMPQHEAVALVLTLAEAIAYAHRLGLLHLDLKPANVLLDARGEPQIADFGLARHMDAQGGVDAQEVSGTPAFMAPEQILIRQYRLTTATDVYALGALLYRCLTDVSPHGEGGADELIRRAAAGRIVPPRHVKSSIPADLAAVCMKCLELQPADRYADAGQLADDLRRVRDGEPVSVRRSGLHERAARWLRREPRFAGALVIAGLCLFAGMLATAWQWRLADAARREAALQRDVALAAQHEAASERDRAAIASEIGAFLHTRAASGEDTRALQQAQARQLSEWLQTRLPDDPDAQGDALAAFADNVGRFDAEARAPLVYTLVEVLGTRYRDEVIAALSRSAGPRHATYAAMLAFREGADASTRRFGTAMQAALAAQPDDAMTLQVAAVFCPGSSSAATDPASCDGTAAARRLAQIDPENMLPWLLQMADSDEAERVALLRQAAERSHIDDFLGRNTVAYVQAFLLADVPMPASIARPALVLSPDEDPRHVLAYADALALPIPRWSPLMRLCNPADGLPRDPQARADCLHVGTVMARTQGGLITRMVGSAIVRRLAPDTPLAAEMFELRRRYVFVSERNAGMTLSQLLAYPVTRSIADLAEVGELESYARRLEHFGIPSHPPADWQPKNPETLLLPEQRKAAVTSR